MKQDKVRKWLPPKGSLADLPLEKLEAKARKLGFSFEDNFFIIDFNEALQVAHSLNYISADDYHLRWNPKIGLPFFPDIFYSNRGWRDDLVEHQAWRLFLGPLTTRHTEMSRSDLQLSLHKQVSTDRMALAEIRLYSYDEAIQVNMAHGIRSVINYLRLAKQDNRLPLDPNLTFGKEFKNWAIYFGHYPLEKVLEIIRSKNVVQKGKYWHLARNDWRLPLDPSLYGIKDVETLNDIEAFILQAWKNK